MAGNDVLLRIKVVADGAPEMLLGDLGFLLFAWSRSVALDSAVPEVGLLAPISPPVLGVLVQLKQKGNKIACESHHAVAHNVSRNSTHTLRP
jgi:hypothetical protein